MALHAQIAGTLGMPVFFCQKASPWQRPSNEDTNGLLRQYFPKGTLPMKRRPAWVRLGGRRSSRCGHGLSALTHDRAASAPHPLGLTIEASQHISAFPR